MPDKDSAGYTEKNNMEIPKTTSLSMVGPFAIKKGGIKPKTDDIVKAITNAKHAI